MKIALFNAPEVYQSASEPTLLLAASTPTPGWRRQYVEISHAGRTHLVQTPPRKSIFGRAVTVLGVADESVEIVLCDADQWLVSCSDDDLKFRDNLAIIGGEVIQFGEATSLGSGQFRLARLLRGRAGTERAMATHAEREPFVLIERGALQPISLPEWVPGLPVRASAQGGSAECSLVVGRRQVLESGRKRDRRSSKPGV